MRNAPPLARLLVFIALACLAGGCTLFPGSKAAFEDAKSNAYRDSGTQTNVAARPKESRVTTAELDQITKAYADRYMVMLASACDEIARDNPSAQQRAEAHALKTNSAASIYDIVTNADPYTQLLDLTLAITLQSNLYIDENLAEEHFGKRGLVLVKMLRTSRKDIWALAARVMKPEQLDTLDFMIWDFRRQNPTMMGVINVRFTDFAASRAKSVVADVSGGGLFAPVNEATRAVDEVRVLTERAFFYGKRAPLILTWRVEQMNNSILLNAQLQNVLSDVSSIAASADRWSHVLEKLPADLAAERKAILLAIEQQGTALNKTLDNARLTIAEAEKLIVPVNETAKSATALAAELSGTARAVNDMMVTIYGGTPATPPTTAPAPPPKTDSPPPTKAAVDSPPVPAPASTLLFSEMGNSSAASAVPQAIPSDPANTPPALAPHPFDIRDYTPVLKEASGTARELTAMLNSARGLVDSEAWTSRIEQVNKAADDRVKSATEHSRQLVDSIFFRIYIAIAVMFIAGVTYKIIALKLTRSILGTKKTAGVE